MRSATWLRRPRVVFGAAVLVPTLLWYSVFVIRPVLQTIWIAFHRYQLGDPDSSRFVGLDNFRQLLANPRFFVAVQNTIEWTVLAFVVMVPLALLISLCLVSIRRGRNLYQAIIFVPVVVSLVAVALLFRILMDPEVGILNRILAGVGMTGFRWLSDSDTALPVLLGIAVWKSVGVHVVILTAGLLAIPEELYDAAKVDGAGPLQTFCRITFPLLGNTLALVAVLLSIGALQEYTLPTVVTEGGPGDATFLFSMLVYEEAFLNIRFGTASAAALLQFGVILVASLVWLRLLRPRWSY